ncbi:unnamed protein product [Polarella glacialis]|uniref:Uncharacterized protein n=2 Tax=Polarella glacialis TaxID=89957 RepID=A0A813LBQ7_POLGL|nr:unnamed protein product [Polarella glacialis]
MCITMGFWAVNGSEAESAETDLEDVIPDNWFIRLVHFIAWLLTVVLSVVSIFFISYQLYSLYVPYCLAKLTGNSGHRFPEYFYRVWGKDATDLTTEHWGYLGACAVVTFTSVRFVVPHHPFGSRSEAHAKAE